MPHLVYDVRRAGIVHSSENIVQQVEGAALVECAGQGQPGVKGYGITSTATVLSWNDFYDSHGVSFK